MQQFKDYRNRDYQEALDSDANLRRWYFNTAKGSVITADTNLRRLAGFCRANHVTPGEYAKFPKRRMEEMAFDFIQELETKINPKSGEKYSPGYVVLNLKAIHSWAKWNRKTFEMKIKIADTHKTPTLANERVPTTDELRHVLYADTTPLRTRAQIAVIAFAGCRPEVQGNYLGQDGLRLRDMPELEVEGGEVSFAKAPTLIIVRAELSKNRHWYPTFMLAEGCEIIKQYLQRRVAEGELLTPESALISTSERNRKLVGRMGIIDDFPFLRTTKLGNEIRKAMRAAGLPWRPYVFRSYFDTMQILAESKGYISHPYVQAFMGHGDIEATYSLRKAELPPELLEDMRSAYGRVSELLGTMKGGAISANSMLEMFNRQFLKISGYSDEEIIALGDLSAISPDRLTVLQNTKSMQSLGLKNGARQKIIPWPELREAILGGWELVTKLEESNEAIARLPTR